MAPPDDLRATLSPGAVVTGETVTVDVTSPADVDKLTVEIVEVDQGTVDEPQKGADALVARFTGKMVGGLFTLVPRGTPAKPLPNPELNPRPGDNPPKIKLSIGGTDHEVLLPGRDNENGIFELQIKMSAPGHTAFRGRHVIFVRDFQHWPAQGLARPVITFVTGQDSDTPGNPFMSNAVKFWKEHADAVFHRPGISIAEITAFLNKNQSKFGDWGEINIVSHGSLFGINIRLFRDKDGGITDADRFDEVFGDNIDKQDISTLSVSGLDSDSRVVFRACNAGNDQPLLTALHEKWLESKCPVFVPKHVQVYSSGGSGNAEFFQEMLFFFHPAATKPDAATTDARFKAEFLKRNPGGDWDAERALFTNHDEEQPPARRGAHTLKMGGDESILFTDIATGQKKTDTDFKADFVAGYLEQKLQEHDRFAFAQPTAWFQVVVPPRQTGTRNDAYWFEATGGSGTKAVPQNALLDGTISLGSGSNQAIQLSGKGVGAQHATVTINGDDIAVENVSGEKVSVTMGGKTFALPPKGSDTGSVTGTERCTVTLGSATVVIRRPRNFEVVVRFNRQFLQRRREMKSFDPAIPFRSRVRVQPDLANGDHYGKEG